jgi:hypothetical protein
MRQFLVSPYSEEAGLAPTWHAGVARDGKDEKITKIRNTQYGGDWEYTVARRERKMGSLI